MTDQHLKLTGNLVLDTMLFTTGANMFALITLSDPVQMALIQAAFGFLTVTFGGVITLMLKRMERNVAETKVAVTEAKIAIKDTQEQMVVLKEQTNHIKDALVAKTEAEALLRGETVGRDKAEAKAEAKAAAVPPATAADPATGQIPFTGATGTIELKATVNPPKT